MLVPEAYTQLTITYALLSANIGIFLNVYLFILREREKERMSRERAERGGEKIIT